MIEWKEMDMRDIGTIFASPLFEAFFFIASFHHLETFEERLNVLEQTKKALVPGGKIYMTNWYLLSEENQKKYHSSKITEYPDESGDFSIKIGKHSRFYHSFSLSEYQKLAQESGLQLEKCDFGERNSVMILSL
jgi:SAM-dependent methyltransferase